MITIRSIQKAVVFLFTLAVLTASCYASTNLTLQEKPRESTLPYTLGDLAASRLAVYGILEEKYRVPIDETGQPLGRLEAVAILYSAFAKDGDLKYERTFTDVSEEYAKEVAWAYSSSVAYGVSETEFGIDDITEKQFLTMLLRVMGYQNFEYSEAIQFARTLGLSPVGKSHTFSLGDASLYLQDAMKLNAADGRPLREKMQISEYPLQTTFPSCIRLIPTNELDAELQLKEAVRYLPTRIEIVAERISQEELYRVYQGYLFDSLDLKNGSYHGESWYLPCLSDLSGISPSVDFQMGKMKNYLVLTLKYNNAWILTCDLDDAFSKFDSDDLTRAADRFYQSCIRTEKTEEEIVLDAKKAVMDHARYSSEGKWTNGTRVYPAKAHNLQGFFENGEIVCDGYADLFQYLMIRAGIPCVTVLGSTKGKTDADNGNYDHAWNKVRLDGKWLNMDVCWADSSSTDRYDLRTDEYFADHEHWAVSYRAL